MSFDGMSIDLAPGDLLADLNESPGVVAIATFDRLDIAWLDFHRIIG